MPPRYHQTSITLALNGHQHWWIYGIPPIFFQSTSTFVILFIKSLFHKSRHQLQAFRFGLQGKLFFFWFRVRQQGPQWHLSIGETWRPGNSPNWVAGIGLLPGVAIARPGPPVRGGGPRWRLLVDAYGISNPQGIWENPNTCLWDFFHRSTYKACWNQEETLHERVNTHDRPLCVFVSGCFDARIYSYITINISLSLYIYTYIYIFTHMFYINIIFLHIRAYNHIHIYIHCITSHHITSHYSTVHYIHK